MGLFKDKKDLKKSSARFSTSGGARTEISPLRPKYSEKLPPCTGHCPSGNDIRGWLTVLAQREKMGLSVGVTDYDITPNFLILFINHESGIVQVCPEEDIRPGYRK